MLNTFQLGGTGSIVTDPNTLTVELVATAPETIEIDIVEQPATIDVELICTL